MERLVGRLNVGGSREVTVSLNQPVFRGATPRIYIRIYESPEAFEQQRAAAWLSIPPAAIPGLEKLLTAATRELSEQSGGPQ